ncbi:benzoate/H(+) symporter BenE family transporter [Aestuariispira insulae]|uniref:Benzoate membrane transport protein n=1 Tax=Aestuariispira insulae TaxID=1461337 RepID=A0A3D9HRT2_9PROT|nr:benzoate/H(+) symporter BenE family transporter [Aestuariispira insulae]RED52208.1 benzoate membrane transport protein [Aestuariispira insulae]
MFRHLVPGHISAGFVSVLVGYTGAAAIVFQAAQAAGATPDQVGSWMLALGLGMGLCGIGLTLWFKQPVLIAWSTPGAALLTVSLAGVSMAEAVGAFLFCSALITICGLTGLFDRLVNLIPKTLASAMLAGVLLQFGLKAFLALETGFAIAGGMMAAYLAGRLFWNRYAIPVTFLAGILLSMAGGMGDGLTLPVALTMPVFVIPEFNPAVLIGVGIPLFIVTMAGQNLPGIAVMRAHGYDAPASPLITWSGITGLVLAPIGGFAFNLAAITAAICMGRDVDEKPERCYLAAVWCGGIHVFVGLFGATIAALFAAFPQEMVLAIAGLALLGTIGGSLKTAMAEDGEREAAMICFTITASGLSLFSIGAAFWGIAAGMAVHGLMSWRTNRSLARREQA